MGVNAVRLEAEASKIREIALSRHEFSVFGLVLCIEFRKASVNPAKPMPEELADKTAEKNQQPDNQDVSSQPEQQPMTLDEFVQGTTSRMENAGEKLRILHEKQLKEANRWYLFRR